VGKCFEDAIKEHYACQRQKKSDQTLGKNGKDIGEVEDTVIGKNLKDQISNEDELEPDLTLCECVIAGRCGTHK